MKKSISEYQELERKVAGLEKELETYKSKARISVSNEKNFASFFNSLDDFIFILDMKGQIVLVNDYVIKRLGYSREELQGMSVLQVHPPERREEAMKIVTEMLEGSTKFCPIPLLCKNGAYIPVETRITKGFWDEKEVMLGISKDISAIILSEEKFSKAFHHNANLMAITLVESGKYIDVNDSFLKTLGLKREEVIGKTSVEFNLLTPDNRSKLLEIVQSGGKLSGVELTFDAKGNTFYGLFSAEIIYVQDKKCWLAVLQDITELKKNEQKLKESETRLRLTIEGAKIGTWDWNIITGKVIFNEYWAKMLGYTLDEIGSDVSSWEKLLNPEDSEGVLNILNRHLRGETEYFYKEQRLFTKSGEWKWILAVGKVIERDEKGNAVRAIGTHVDIDDLKTANEKLLVLNTQLQELNLAKDKLFSIIAHDLRNPFSSILGLSELLRDESGADTPEKRNAFINRIYTTTKSTYNLLEDLLIWAKSQFDKTDFMPEKIALVDLFEEVISLFQEAADQKNIHIVYHLPEPGFVLGDKNMVRAILRNLVSNAIKFTNRDGWVEIFTARNNNESEITVSDTGKGMTAEEISKLFVLGQNKTKQGTENERGTGLGLILCFDLVNRNNGKIWVESEPGKGSKFKFTIPVSKE